MSRIVSFRQMQHGTREDYLLLDESERAYAGGLAERVLDALRHLDHSLEGYPVSRLSTRCRPPRARSATAPTRS